MERWLGEKGEALPGVVYLVGAGPGAADLITLRGWRLLQSCDDVVHDALVDPALYADLDCERHDVGKRSGHHKAPQSAINDKLVALARAGRRVVRLKGGDPFVLGRGSEELVWLAAHNVPTLVVPGVSSAIGGPALAGIPVTHRKVADAFCVVSAHPRAEDGTFSIPPFDPRVTVVVLMGVRSLARWHAELLRLGYPPELPMAFVTWAGRPEQTELRTTVGAYLDDAAALQSPSVAVIGHVASRDLPVEGL